MLTPSFFFKCKTLEGHILKYVVEVLQNNFKVIYFDVDANGMNVRNIDDNQNIMLDVTLDGSRFVSFQCKSKITIGVHIDHMFKIIKTIKKQDSVTLIVLEDEPGMLRIDIERDSVCFCTSKLPLQTVQLRNIDLPPSTQYVHVINLSSRDFFQNHQGGVDHRRQSPSGDHVELHRHSVRQLGDVLENVLDRSGHGLRRCV